MQRRKVLREDLFWEIIFKQKPKGNGRATYLRPCSELLATSSWPAYWSLFITFYEISQALLRPPTNSMVHPDFSVLWLAKLSPFFWNLFLPSWRPSSTVVKLAPFLATELTTFWNALLPCASQAATLLFLTTPAPNISSPPWLKNTMCIQ